MEILTSVRRLYISFKSLVNDFVYSFGRAALLLLVEVLNHTVPVRERRRIRVNRTQSRVVVGLLTGHNTLRRHLCIMGLSNSAIFRKYGIEVETSIHILCVCEALASLRHT